MKSFILNILLLAGLLLSLASCVSEIFADQTITGEDEWCNIDFSHKSYEQIEISTKATLDITQESRVLNMFVFLFSEDGNRIYSRYFDKNNKRNSVNEVTNADANCWFVTTEEDGYTYGTIRIKAPKVTNATLYMIANLDEDMMNISSDLLNTITTVDEIEALNVTLMQETTSRNGYFPMVARLDGVAVNNTSINAGKALLERLDTKITLNIKLAENQSLKSFIPSMCRIRNIPAGSRVVNVSSRADFEEAGYFDSEIIFDEQTTNSSGNVNGAVCSFYMLENRESKNLKNTVNRYHDRDKRIKNPDGTYNTADGMWLNAPENATYLEIVGEIHMEVDTDETGIQELIGEVVYFVHLGNFGKNINDYDVLRNTHYTYNI